MTVMAVLPKPSPLLGSGAEPPLSHALPDFLTDLSFSSASGHFIAFHKSGRQAFSLPST